MRAYGIVLVSIVLGLFLTGVMAQEGTTDGAPSVDAPPADAPPADAPPVSDQPPAGDQGAPQGDQPLTGDQPPIGEGQGPEGGPVGGDMPQPGPDGEMMNAIESFTGPGGCNSPESCMSYCSANPQECAQQMRSNNDEFREERMASEEQFREQYFAEGQGPESGPQGQGIQEGEEHRGPGGCNGPRECFEYCKANRSDPDCRGGDDNNRRRGPEGGGPPKVIPQEIVDAGPEAQTSFITTVCTGMKVFANPHLVCGFNAMADYITTVGTEIGATTDVTPLRQLASSGEEKIAAVCSATPETFTQVMTDFESLIQQDTIQSTVEGIMMGLMESKVNEAETCMQSKQAEMTALQQQMQSGGSPEAAQALGSQMQALGEGMRECSAGMEAMGQKFEGMETAMTTACPISEANQLEFANAMIDMIDVMFGSQVTRLTAYKEKLSALDFDVSKLDQVLAEMEQARTSMKSCVQNLEPEEEPDKCMVDIKESKAPAWEQLIRQSVERQIEERYLSVLNDLLPKIKQGVSLAKEKGIDTTQIEKTLTNLENLKGIGGVLNESTDKDDALGLIEQLHTNVQVLKKQWAVLIAELKE